MATLILRRLPRRIQDPPTPVFDLKPRHSRHAVEIRRHELRTARERMSGDRRVEILDSSSAAFETGLDAAVGLADGICPLRSRNLSTNQIETRLQGLATLGPRQAIAISAITG